MYLESSSTTQNNKKISRVVYKIQTTALYPTKHTSHNV